MQAINEQGKQGSTEWAALPQPHRRGFALPTEARDPWHSMRWTQRDAALKGTLQRQQKIVKMSWLAQMTFQV